MGDITSASLEQSQGVSQVGEAVMQMDQVTQQNAAMAEQMVAAASSLEAQAKDLVLTVAAFKLADTPTDTEFDADVRQVAARSPRSRPTIHSRPVKAATLLGRPQAVELALN